MQPVSPDATAASPFADAPAFSSPRSHDHPAANDDNGWGFQDVPLRGMSQPDDQIGTIDHHPRHDNGQPHSPGPHHGVPEQVHGNGKIVEGPPPWGGSGGHERTAEENEQLKQRLTHLEEVHTLPSPRQDIVRSCLSVQHGASMASC